MVKSFFAADGDYDDVAEATASLAGTRWHVGLRGCWCGGFGAFQALSAWGVSSAAPARPQRPRAPPPFFIGQTCPPGRDVSTEPKKNGGGDRGPTFESTRIMQGSHILPQASP